MLDLSEEEIKKQFPDMMRIHQKKMKREIQKLRIKKTSYTPYSTLVASGYDERINILDSSSSFDSSSSSDDSSLSLSSESSQEEEERPMNNNRPRLTLALNLDDEEEKSYNIRDSFHFSAEGTLKTQGFEINVKFFVEENS